MTDFYCGLRFIPVRSETFESPGSRKKIETKLILGYPELKTEMLASVECIPAP
jgi:hypothetical protein